MSRSLSAALLLGVAFAGRAAAEPGRAAALTALVSALPDKNPNEDPGYLDVAGYTLPDQLAACRWDEAQTASIERLVRLFDKYITLDGGGKDALLKAIAQLPDFADKAKDPQQAKNFAQLSLGVRLAPDMTKAHLVNEACKLLLRMHFDNGASKAQLADAVAKAKPALDAAPKPD